MRVLVVDDSAFMRTALSRMINEDPHLEVVDTARNGEDAIEKTRRLKPDLVTLDIEMPKMDGLAALPAILKAEHGAQAPAVLMCSSLTTTGSNAALEAMKLGASDFIAKDNSFASTEIAGIKDALVAKLRAIGRGRTSYSTSRVRKNSTLASLPPITPADIDAVVIGSSTGGPPVLEEIITSLPPDLTVPIVIAQHMPAIFTKSMATRLDDQSAVTVIHADDNMPLVPGCVFVIEGGKHGKIRKAGTRKYTLTIGTEPSDALYKPSINELFSSAARALRSRCLSIVLTGMGDDGSIGGRELREAGGRMLAQDAESCVVYGMPKSVFEKGLSEASLTPSAIALTLAQLTAPVHTPCARKAG